MSSLRRLSASRRVRLISEVPLYTQLINSDLKINIKVMKTPADASLKVDGNRHLNGMKIDSNALKV